MGFSYEVVGVDRVVEHLGQFSELAKAKLRAGMSRITIDLQRYVKEFKLSGQVLNRRTGRLIRSINQRVTSGDQEIVGAVGTNVGYGIAHEFGVNKTVTVRQHMRLQTMAWGKELKDPRYVSVKAHPMKMNLPERSFLRSAFREKKDAIVKGLDASLKEAVKQENQP